MIEDVWANPILLSVAFADPGAGWAVGSGGVILATSDGGASWARQQSGTIEDLWSVTFTDPGAG